MNSVPTTPHVSSSWSWLFPRRRRFDEEQGNFGEFSDEDETMAIAIPIPIPLSIEIEQQDGAPQIQGAAPQNSWRNDSMPLNESEVGSAIMSNAVPIILGVAALLFGLDLFGVFNGEPPSV